MRYERNRQEESVGDFMAREEAQESKLLFSRTMMVLTGMIGLSYLGTFLSWGAVWSMSEFFAMSVVFLVTGIGASVWGASAAKSKDPSSVVGAGVFALVAGIYLGPTLGMYQATLGSNTVATALGITGGVTALMGALSTVVTFDYRRVEGYMLMALWGLIGFGVGSLFWNVPPGMDFGVSIGGALLFAGFLLVDLLRLKDEAKYGGGSWGMAVLLSVNIFLDMVNLLLYILQAFAAAQDDD